MVPRCRGQSFLKERSILPGIAVRTRQGVKFCSRRRRGRRTTRLLGGLTGILRQSAQGELILKIPAGVPSRYAKLLSSIHILLVEFVVLVQTTSSDLDENIFSHNLIGTTIAKFAGTPANDTASHLCAIGASTAATPWRAEIRPAKLGRCHIGPQRSSFPVASRPLPPSATRPIMATEYQRGDGGP